MRNRGTVGATFADLQDVVTQIRAPMDWLLAAAPAHLWTGG